MNQAQKANALKGADALLSWWFTKHPEAAFRGQRGCSEFPDDADEIMRRMRECVPQTEKKPFATLCAAIAANDVSISPSRWEGLGLPLYEAVAFGMPTIANDDPPMNEVVADDVNGVLVPSHPDGTARSGIPARRPDVGAMTAAIEHVADPTVLERLRRGTDASRADHRWERTVAALGELLSPRGGA